MADHRSIRLNKHIKRHISHFSHTTSSHDAKIAIMYNILHNVLLLRHRFCLPLSFIVPGKGDVTVQLQMAFWLGTLPERKAMTD